MSKTIKSILVAGLMGLSASVLALDLKADAPQSYTVKKGDTLWGISERFTDDPWQWPEIWYLNDQINDPHLIFPGDVLGLVTVNGTTRLTVTQRSDASRTVKLSPGTVKMQPSVRVEPIEAAIPAIPQDAIRGFLRDHRVVEPVVLEGAPRLIAGGDGALVMGAGNTVYARGKFEQPLAGAYSIYRRGQLYRDPQTREVLGLEALDIGMGRVQDSQGDIVTLLLERSNQQVSIGDVVLPTEDRNLISHYHPSAPNKNVNGVIMAVSGGISQIGQYDVVVLNRGARDGLEPGHTLLAKKAGQVVYDRTARERVRLPDERAGTVMVFRVFDKMSYALVMRTTKPLKVGDLVENPNNQ